jgi:MFS family permease
MADTFAMLLVGRGLQGLGVSLVAMTIAAARAYLPPRNARSTVALLSITTALGAGISYPLTTAVADHFGMSAAFALAAAFAAIVGVLVVIRLPSAFEGTSHKPDVVGALLLASGVTAYLLGITHGNAWGWTSPAVLGLGLLGTLIVAGWVAWELHTDYPLVRLPLLADRRVLAAAAVALFMGMSLYSAPVLVSRLAQMPSSTGYGAGLSLTAAGAIMIPIAVGNLLGSRITLWADRLGGARFSLALGSVLAMSGTLLIVFTHVSVVILVLAMSLTAIGAGATFGAMPALIIAAVAGEETGSAMSFNLLLRTVGGTIGSALTAAALGAHVSADAEYPSWSGFQLAFLVCAGACFAALAAGLLLLRGPATRPPRW